MIRPQWAGLDRLNSSMPHGYFGVKPLLLGTQGTLVTQGTEGGTHTVVDPRAVVVHLKDAALAQAAVVCTVGLWQHALLAEAWLQRNWPQLYS